MTDTGLELNGTEWLRLGEGVHAPRVETALDDLVGSRPDLRVDELVATHWPLCRLVTSLTEIHRERQRAVADLIGTPFGPSPFVVGVTGAVAAGKSVTAEVLRTLLAADDDRRVDVVSTDGFLFSDSELDRRGLTGRKGFPESYDHGALLAFLEAVKSGRRRVPAPIYDHVTYDVVADHHQVVDQPDILLLEGVNVLQGGEPASGGPLVSDFLDFSIYVDADEADVRGWFLRRMGDLRARSAGDPTSFFARFEGLDDAGFQAVGELVWDTVNRPNLEENIAPTLGRADLVLEKAADHTVRRVRLRQR